MIVGVILAMCGAFFESLLDVLRKKNAERLDAMVVSWALVTFSTLFSLVPLFLLESKSFPTSFEFWMALGISLALNSVSGYLYVSILMKAELSLVLPLITLSLVFLLITGPLINHEIPSAIGVVGIFVIVFGTYGLKYENRGAGWFAPITSLWKDRSAQKMLLVAFLWACSSPFDKRATMAGSPLWFLVLISAGLALMYTPFMFQKQRWSLFGADRNWLKLIPLGAVNTITVWCFLSSLTFLFVPYAIGLKRLSILFGVLWGRWIFKEKHTQSRAVAASVMLAGSLMILWATLR